MILLWILFGVSAAIATMISYYWIKFGVPHMVLTMNFLGVALFLFSILWVIYSMDKGESVMAAIGLLSFGTSGILFILLGWKILEVKNSRNQ